MNIQFKNIIINNFLSFEDAEVSLDNQSYTIIQGINENIDDAAKSNGAGKSAIFEAISWCLTGETIRGCKEVSNIHTNNGTLVELNFSIDNTTYKLIRCKNHTKYKTNLKIYINGEDKSGKGIRDTEKLLANYLPDLNSALLGSVIVLGQGLPMRFTNNTPSGRKEVLEKLSKSDFMIEDLKTKITNRKISLNSSIKQTELQIAEASGELSAKESEQTITKARLEEIQQQVDFDSQLAVLTSEISELSQKHSEATQQLDALKTEEISIRAKNENIATKKALEINKISEANNASLLELTTTQTAYKTEIHHLQAEINKLESIKDICPTCGQKLSGVEKPDTSELYAQLEQAKQKLEEISDKHSMLCESITKEKIAIEEKYIEEERNQNAKSVEISSNISNLSKTIQIYVNQIKAKEVLQADIMAQKASRETKIADYSSRLIELASELELLDTKLQELNKTLATLHTHLDIINKFNTIITRDFRGYLLSNIITFIDTKAKEYSQFVFGTDKISFIQDGNNINILYDNKNYDNLSGGEKQKIDLIIQFAIRDMLCRYLNFSSNIIVLDEIFDNLDDIGCQKVLDLISNKLNDVNSIFIITHHSDISIPADNEITVIKGSDKISRIKQ